MAEIKAVCFDGFGAVVLMDQGQDPLERLLEYDARRSCAAIAMTRGMSLREAARSDQIAIEDEILEGLELDLSKQCASSRTRAEMDGVWAALRRLRIKIAICSNMSAPYEESLLACLPGIPDALSLSFEIGCLNTQSLFFELLAAELQLNPADILYVGNLSDGSIATAQMTGMFAVPVDEFMQTVTGTDPDEMPGALSDFLSRLTRTARLHPQRASCAGGGLGPTVRSVLATDTIRRSRPEPFDHLPI